MTYVFTSGSVERWNVKTPNLHVAMQIHSSVCSLLLSKAIDNLFPLCNNLV